MELSDGRPPFRQSTRRGRRVAREIVDHVAGWVEHLRDAVAGAGNAAGGKRVVGGGLVHDRYAGRAERHRLVGADFDFDAHGMGHVADRRRRRGDPGQGGPAPC